MTEAQAFVEISSRSATELAEKYVALWNEPDADRRRRMIAELWTRGREAHPPAAAGDPRDRGATRDRHDGDPRGTGIRGDRGSRGQRLRALGRLRGAQLPRARRRRTTRRRRQVPLGGGRQGRRRWSQSGSASSSSPRTAGSNATTRSSSLRRDGTGHSPSSTRCSPDPFVILGRRALGDRGARTWWTSGGRSSGETRRNAPPRAASHPVGMRRRRTAPGQICGDAHGRTQGPPAPARRRCRRDRERGERDVRRC